MLWYALHHDQMGQHIRQLREACGFDLSNVGGRYADFTCRRAKMEICRITTAVHARSMQTA